MEFLNSIPLLHFFPHKIIILYRNPALSGINIFTNADLLKLEFLSQAKNIPIVLPSFKIWSKTVQGFKSYDRTSKQRLLLDN